MMARAMSFIFLVEALLIITSHGSAENVYCVTPTAISCSSCPHTTTNCTTLSEYAQEAEMYFTSNTTMLLLPGDHVLDINITIGNVARLTMCGVSSSERIATVVRNGSVGFSFTNMVDFNIHSLAFTSCKRSWSYGSHPGSTSALFLHSTQNAKLVNCSFHDNVGTALAVCNTSITLVENEFTQNQCTCEPLSKRCNSGCGITALNSILTFTGNTTFLKNKRYNVQTSEVGAGAISAVASTLKFNGINNFVNNVNDGGHTVKASDKVGVGGAIYITKQVVLTFSGTNNFINNSADNGGGVIYSSKHSILKFTGTNNFIGNHAISGDGGAIYTLDHVALTFIGTNTFINSSGKFGGAIYAGGKVSLTFIGNSHFSNNTANFGGVFWIVVNVVLTFNGTNNFTGNSANSGGGAIYTLENILVSFTGTINFISNYVHSGSGGAIYTLQNADLSFNGTNNFINNHANRSGGAIYTSRNVVLAFNGIHSFIKNSAGLGGAIYTNIKISITVMGTSNFSNNSAQLSGGAVYMNNNTVFTLNKISNFINNSADYGGALCTSYHVVLSFTGINNFINNSAVHSGGAISTSHVVYTFTGTNNFIGNSVELGGGGAINAWKTVFAFTGTNNFIGNSVELGDGGAIYTGNTVFVFTGTNNFIKNSANAYFSDGGAIYTSNSGNVVLTFNGTNNFTGNLANDRGGTIYSAVNVSVILTGITDFSKNYANTNGGAIYADNNVSLSCNGTSTFNNNLAMKGGAIAANRKSKLTFGGNITFGHNTGKRNGGAIYLSIGSTFFILPHTTACWKNNHAHLGGAIYVSDVNSLTYCNQVAPYIPKEECFFQFPGQNLPSGLDIKFTFKYNSADDAGSVLYGGTIDNCKLSGLSSYSSGELFNILFHIDNTDYSTTSRISSDPLRVCPCKSDLPECSRQYYDNSYMVYSYSVYPGETFHVSVITVGQRKGIVSSTVRSRARTYSIGFQPVNLLDNQYLQETNSSCTALNYTVFSLSQKVNIELHPEGSPCSKYDGGLLNISVSLNQTCPPGFNISDSARSCVCEPRLAQYTNQCNITNGLGQITREPGQHFWVGYDTSSDELILHPNCPLDYCVNNAKVFPLNNTDIQCEYNRSGLLCGQCKGGYSLALGTHHCRKCTNIHILLLIPIALMGVALVFLLLVSKLTVATGTLSGLVFYANIVGVNRAIFLPLKSTDPLSVFIAWINLDLGIETCFYHGMNAYSKTWLQFVFPVYIWVLVGLIILISHFSKKFAHLLGSNPVSVLATLILLSYAKVLRTLITAVYVTYLEYPANHKRMVWLYDANNDYLVGRHIPLFLVAVLVFLFLFLPYTLLLLFGQWLQAISHLRIFSWVNSARLKPFMDSYHAPYKAKHRYWPGLLLVLRFGLLLVFALNPKQDSNINLLIILLGAGILQMWAWVSGGVYKNWCLDALEGSFALNLIVLAASAYYVKLSKGNELVFGYTSVIIAFATFIGILTYHIFQQVRNTKLWKKVPKLNLELKKLSNNKAVDNLDNLDFDQLREPLLEDLPPPTHSVV